MILKKIKIIGVFVIFLLCFLYHFAYDLFPNYIFSIIFPVNESIWEHMKLFYFSIITWSIIEYFIFKKKNIKFNNFIPQVFITSYLSIFIYLILYYVIFSFIKDNFIITILLMFIVIALVEYIGYKILNMDEYNKVFKVISIIFLGLGIILFWLFTYYPIRDKLFYDSLHKVYGIYKK